MLKKFFLPWSITLVFFLCYSTISLKLYANHQTRGDLTAYAQGMWNTLNGHFMASTYNYSVHNYYDGEFREINEDNSNIFGIHFNPIILAFIPFYRLFARPETLLVIQALLVSCGGFIIYLIARKLIKNDWIALSLQFAYLIYFSTVSATLSQFHGYTLALFFAPLLLYFSLQKSDYPYYLSLILFLLVQENTSLVAFFFGLYLLLNPITRKRGVWTTILSLTYFVTIIQWVIPCLSPYHSYLFGSIYGNVLGNSIPQIIVGSIKHPLVFLESIFTGPNIIYLRNLMIGIFPFALFSPAMLLVASSSLAQNILSSSLGLKTQQMHYESGAVAFLFYAVILGIAFFLKYTKYGKSKYGCGIVFILITISTLVSYKQFTSPRFNPTLLSLPLYTELDREMDDFQQAIPTGSSVSTEDYLSAQLSSRAQLYQYPIYQDRVDYLLLSTKDAVWPLTSKEQQEYIKLIRENGEYRVIKESPNFVLFKHDFD